MYESEYKDLVLADFDRQKTARILPSELLSPTPGGLKSLSVDICGTRPDPKDEIILQSFFGTKANTDAYRLTIQNASADPFRPLVTFLKDRSVKTAPRNINLLAWLIDFKPRPFHPDLVISEHLITGTPVTRLMQDISTNGVSVKHPGQPLNKQRRNATMLLAIMIVVALGSYYVITNKTLVKLNSNEKCMVWEEDHYEPVGCNVKLAQKLILRIDRKVVMDFRKIMEQDTLTPYSIGKVWYIKYKGRIEFFTTDGPYPLDTNRRLLPMTSHILEKYIYHIRD